MKINNKVSILLFVFVLNLAPVFAQKSVIDSLENVLASNTTKDTTRVNNLDHLSFLYYRKDLNKAIEYIEKAEALANELNYGKGKGNATYMRGVVELMQSNFEVAREYFENAAQIYAAHGIKKNMAGCFNGIGIIYSYQGNYEQSTVYYKKALEVDKEVGMNRNIPNYIINIGINYYKIGKYPEAATNFKESLELYTALNNTLGISSSLKNIALVYQSQGNYPLALEYDNKALLLAKKIQDSTGISNSLNNMSIIYKFQENYDKALELLEKAMAIQKNLKNNKGIAGIKNNMASIYIRKKEYTTAITYLNESLEINRKISAKNQIAECLNNLGSVYASLKKFDEANRYYKEAKSINLEIDSNKGLSTSYKGIAESYIQQKRYNEALSNAIKSLEIAEEMNLLDHKRDAYELLSEIYENTYQYKNAFESHQQFKVLNDSLFNKENIEKIAQLEYEYKYKQQLDSANIRELKLTKTVKDTSQNLEKSQRNYLWSIIAFLLISMVLGGIIFYLKFRNIKAKTHSIIVEQKLLRSQMTPHFIFNSLSVLQGMILNKEEKKSVVYLSKFSKLLRIILENSRDKVVPLSQELEAVENYLSLQNLENESYTYAISVEDTIDTSSFEIPPMLIQPFVENAIEHAFTSEMEDKLIDVYLKYEDQKLVCTIVDNGIGINTQRVSKRKDKTSLATTITSERLKILSKDFNMEGSVTIENRQKYSKHGTIVTILIPHNITKAS